MNPGTQKVKVTVYVDGFNLYHSINALKKNYLKWLHVWQLAATFLRPNDELQAVYFYTAMTYGAPEKQARHSALITALQSYGVKVIESPFLPRKRWCDHRRSNPEGGYCKFHEEKQSDVAMAVQMISDAQSGATEKIILLTADADQVPAVQYLRRAYPGIPIILAIPPGRKREARGLAVYCTDHDEIGEGRLFANLMPPVVSNPNFVSVSRPEEYRPPSGSN